MSEEEAILNIRIEGKVKEEETLNPSNFDINEISEMLIHIDHLLRSRITEKLPISYDIHPGSVINTFKGPKSLIERFNSTVSTVNKNGSLSGVDEKQAKAFEYFQEMSRNKTRTVTFTNSLDPDLKLVMTPESDYRIVPDTLMETELYIYGKVTSIGGKTSPCIKIDTDEYGLVRIYTKEYVIRNITDNLLYKEIGVHIKAKQSIYTFKLYDANFIKFISFSREYDEQKMNKIFEKSRKTWEKVEYIDEWLKGIRG